MTASHTSIGRLVIGAVLAAYLPLAAHAEDTMPPLAHPELVRTYYDFGIMEYCRLVDPQVQGGYDLLRQDQVVQGNIGEQADRSAWIDAVVAVDTEFLNRGLGGQRNWCRIEGAAAAARFTTYYHTRKLP